MKFFKLLTSLFLALVITGCQSTTPVMNLENQSVPTNLTKSQVATAILDAADSKGWNFVTKTSTSITLKLMVRSHTAQVNIPYSNNSYSISYVSSTNLNYTNNRIHPNYNRWIANLNKGIQHKLSLSLLKTQE